MKNRFLSFLVLAAIFSAAVVMSSCGKDGEDGAKGDKGDQGEQGAQGVPGAPGADGTVVTVGADGFWYIDNQKTDYKAIGTDGVDGNPGTPGTVVTIIEGYWAFDGVKSEHKAIGEDGIDGGSNVEIEISDDGYWIINGDKTDIKATGEAGSQVEVKADGFLWINGEKTEIQVHECVKTFTMTFLLNAFDTEPYLTQTVLAGGWAREPSKAPTKEGTVFEFWYKANENIVEPFDFDTPVTDDITVVAKWQGENPSGIYSVTFNSNGGSAVTEQTIAHGGKADKPDSNPTQAGFVFAGWFTDDGTFNDRWNFDVNIVTDDVTLFAKWGDWENITDDLLKNTVYPFDLVYPSLHGGRYFKAEDWTFNVTDEVPQNGNVDNQRGNVMVIIASAHDGWPGQTITNGKLYQTVELEAGIYKFEVVVVESNYPDDTDLAQVYLAAALGNSLPNTNDVEQQALGFCTPRVGILRTDVGNTANDEMFSFEFEIAEKTNITLGAVASFQNPSMANPYQGIYQIHFRKFELFEVQ